MSYILNTLLQIQAAELREKEERRLRPSISYVMRAAGHTLAASSSRAKSAETETQELREGEREGVGCWLLADR